MDRQTDRQMDDRQVGRSPLAALSPGRALTGDGPWRPRRMRLQSEWDPAVSCGRQAQCAVPTACPGQRRRRPSRSRARGEAGGVSGGRKGGRARPEPPPASPAGPGATRLRVRAGPCVAPGAESAPGPRAKRRGAGGGGARARRGPSVSRLAARARPPVARGGTGCRAEQLRPALLGRSRAHPPPGLSPPASHLRARPRPSFTAMSGGDAGLFDRVHVAEGRRHGGLLRPAGGGVLRQEGQVSSWAEAPGVRFSPGLWLFRTCGCIHVHTCIYTCRYAHVCVHACLLLRGRYSHWKRSHRLSP